jgi:hypothetical protein
MSARRTKELREIAGVMNSMIEDASKASQAGSLLQFKMSISGLKNVHDRLRMLEESTRTASDGFVSMPRVRRQYMLASRELDAVVSLLDDWVLVPPDTTNLAIKIVDLKNIHLQIKRISFAPDLPRPKITPAELAEMNALETSAGIERAIPDPAATMRKMKERAAERYPKSHILSAEGIDAKELVRQVEERKKLLESQQSQLDNLFGGEDK